MSMMVAGVIMTTIPVYAAPLEVAGDASIKYQRDTADGEDTISGTVTSIKLMGEVELGSNWSLYGRLGAQTTTNPLLADYNISPEVYGENKKNSGGDGQRRKRASDSLRDGDCPVISLFSR